MMRLLHSLIIFILSSVICFATRIETETIIFTNSTIFSNSITFGGETRTNWPGSGTDSYISTNAIGYGLMWSNGVLIATNSGGGGGTGNASNWSFYIALTNINANQFGISNLSKITINDVNPLYGMDIDVETIDWATKINFMVKQYPFGAYNLTNIHNFMTFEQHPIFHSVADYEMLQLRASLIMETNRFITIGGVSLYPEDLDTLYIRSHTGSKINTKIGGDLIITNNSFESSGINLNGGYITNWNQISGSMSTGDTIQVTTIRFGPETNGSWQLKVINSNLTVQVHMNGGWTNATIFTRP